MFMPMSLAGSGITRTIRPTPAWSNNSIVRPISVAHSGSMNSTWLKSASRRKPGGAGNSDGRNFPALNLQPGTPAVSKPFRQRQRDGVALRTVFRVSFIGVTQRCEQTDLLPKHTDFRADTDPMRKSRGRARAAVFGDLLLVIANQSHIPALHHAFAHGPFQRGHVAGRYMRLVLFVADFIAAQ